MTSTLAAPSTSGQRAAAWAVHAYTATGAAFALLFLLAGVEGDLREAFLWCTVATLVDATDGALARRFEVKRHTPEFDGSLLDNIVDYLQFVVAPVVLLQQNGFFPDGRTGLLVACVPLLASCYQFCRTDAKTDDHLFWGFPSYWNVLAVYAVLLELSVAVTTSVVLFCAVLVFVPIGYLYPSRTTAFQRSSVGFGALWAVAMLVLVLQIPDAPRWLTLASLSYPVYYTVVSLVLTARRRR